TWDSGTYVVYINGEEVATGAYTGLATIHPVADIANDGDVTGREEGHYGLIDEVRLYDHALDAAEILAAMKSAAYPQASGPSPKDGSLHLATWASLEWRAGDFAVSHDVYVGDNYDDVNDGAGDTFVGNQTETTLLAGFPGFPVPGGFISGTTYYWRVDEVNDADPNSPWKGDIWSFSIPPKTAYFPDPADGAEFVDPNATFSWTPGDGAKMHTFYIGDSFDDVNNATGGTLLGVASADPGPLEAEKVYYWRVDEFDGVETYKGDIWAFTTPGAAGSLVPANGAVDVPMNTALTWTPADNATSHELYFGTDAEAIANATTASPEYVGPKALAAVSHDPGGLDWASSYAWRVDEVYPTGTVKGLVWTFTTADFIAVDDFESYNDIDPPDANSNRIFDKWIDGFGTTTNGALVGNDLPPYAEQGIVRTGIQSMIYRYDNANKTSEATLTLVYPRDWTEGGVTKLILWFRGAGANAADRMFVALNGSAVVYHDDPAVTQLTGWREWVIDLQAFADQGVGLANVNTITIGIGTQNSPSAAGGSGTMYFDDLRLYR
ncbi:MAG: LamG-like jellyroll fold domain-containing protein, partial [Planctomycetota bacterium]